MSTIVKQKEKLVRPQTEFEEVTSEQKDLVLKFLREHIGFPVAKMRDAEEPPYIRAARLLILQYENPDIPIKTDFGQSYDLIVMKSEGLAEFVHPIVPRKFGDGLMRWSIHPSVVFNLGNFLDFNMCLKTSGVNGKKYYFIDFDYDASYRK